MNADDHAASLDIVWIFPGSLHINLDASTWLETTRQLRKAGCQVVLIHAGPRDVKELQGVEVTSIPKPNVYLVRQAIFHFRVYREIAKRWRTADVVLFHHMSLLWLLPWRILRIGMRQSKPIFVKDTRTAPMIPKDVATWRDRMRTVYDNAVNRIANSLADGQTAITYRMAKMMHISDDQLLGVWPSGVTLDKFEVARETRDWKSTSENVHIIYIGALHYQRNLMNLCKAVELANQDQPRFTFTMVGGGTEYDDLKAFAAQTEGRIRVFSPVPHEQVPGLLSQAHVGVLPFPDQERFRVSSPIKLFEYMASGMPILATHISCHTDVVGEGTYAFWAFGEDVDGLLAALESVWDQRLLLQEKGEEAAAAAHNWTWSASALKLQQALLRGLGNSDGAEQHSELLGEGSQPQQ